MTVEAIVCAALTICVLVYLEWLAESPNRWFR